MFRIHLQIFVLAMECRGEKLSPELEEIGAHLPAGERERVECVEVDVGSYGHDDTNIGSISIALVDSHRSSKGINIRIAT